MYDLIEFKNFSIKMWEQKINIYPKNIKRKLQLTIIPWTFMLFGALILKYINSLTPFVLQLNDYIIAFSISFIAYLFGIWLMKKNKKTWITIYNFPPLYYGLTTLIIIMVNLIVPVFLSNDFAVSNNINYQMITIILITYSAIMYTSLIIYVLSWKRSIVITNTDNYTHAVYNDFYIIFPTKLSIKFTFNKEHDKPLKLLIKGIELLKKNIWETSLTAEVNSYSYDEFVALKTDNKMKYILAIVDPIETEKLEAVSILDTEDKREVDELIKIINKMFNIEIVKVADRLTRVTFNNAKSKDTL